MQWVIDVCGWVGSACMLVAYAGRRRVPELARDVLNVAGSVCLGVSAGAAGLMPQALTNGMWMLVAARRLTSRAPASPRRTGQTSDPGAPGSGECTTGGTTASGAAP